MACKHLYFEWTINPREMADSNPSGCRGEFRSPNYKAHHHSTEWYLHFSIYKDDNILQLRRETLDKILHIKGAVSHYANFNFRRYNFDSIMHNNIKHINIFNVLKVQLLQREVTLMCDICITELTKTEEMSVQTHTTYPKVLHDLQNMYEMSDQSDFVLICEDLEIRAHKCVLSSRSPVLAKMFQHVLTESTENRMVITDINPDVLKELLQFIYCGGINQTSYSMIHDLYYAADKYCLPDLKDICRECIVSSLSASTIFKTITLASRHQDEELMQKSLSFLASVFENIKCTEAWTIFLNEDPPLGVQVLSFINEMYSKKLFGA
ncbi:speckle-type POZ protein-like [Stegodyphus dumicola]|uniref:speckle-type POZ protein-like n=1 Tax=Stegodyphus dumicola TaxID=202533 RepID=UPI0015A9287B|nr:speckle-type POZ protein-like [Stegodyphus dumicola]XP_035210779.1 speckle-type POZ protein-like [Stegodyphus dumicola]